VHVVYLAANALAARLLRMDAYTTRAVLIMTSQKSLPVSVTIIGYLPRSLGSAGLLTVPCIVGHISQLFIDAFLAGRMASRDERSAARAAGSTGRVRNCVCGVLARACPCGDCARLR
jgi:solute carrier family 10 (sodium/bile acid cotransporter), member 7